MNHSQRLIGRTLYSRVSSGVTCNVLAMSLGQEAIFFCKITEWGMVEHQILREDELWKYYQEEDTQDLSVLLEAVIRRDLEIPPDRRLAANIQGTVRGAVLKTILKSHPGVITTSHAADGHRALTDYLFAEMSKYGLRVDVLSLNRSEVKGQEPIFMEDTRERGEKSELRKSLVD